MEFLEQKNIEFYNFLDSTFNLLKCKTWDQVAKEITLERVKKTYKYFSHLFPRNQNYFDHFHPSNSFRTIHYGNLKGHSIIDEIVRYSLYSDEILVFHPLQNPALTNPQKNPVKNPKYWLEDFLSALHFYIVLKKWVKTGIVKLIINPVDFDFKLRDEFLGKGKIRVEKYLATESIETKEATDHLVESLTNQYGQRSVEWLKNMLLEIATPIFTEEQAANVAKEIKQAYPKRNPLYEKLNIPLGGGIISQKMGASIESITYLMQLTESNIYTSNKVSWQMLKQMSVNEFWTKANYAYSKADLPFLNNVDTSFVLNLRKENRLSKLRHELKEYFTDLKDLELGEVSEKKIHELNERLIDAIRTSEAEWEKIKSEAEVKRKYWATASVALPVINHEISIFSLIGSAIWLANSIKQENIKLKHLKKTNPLSVYVDIKHKDEGFFSELKNCLF